MAKVKKSSGSLRRRLAPKVDPERVKSRARLGTSNGDVTLCVYLSENWYIWGADSRQFELVEWVEDVSMHMKVHGYYGDLLSLLSAFEKGGVV